MLGRLRRFRLAHTRITNAKSILVMPASIIMDNAIAALAKLVCLMTLTTFGRSRNVVGTYELGEEKICKGGNRNFADRTLPQTK